jgi:hypothetical protein
MKTFAASPFVASSTCLTISFFPLLAALLTSSTHGQDSVPAPKEVFRPDAALILYADLQTASQSGIWKTMEARLAPWMEQMATLSGMPTTLPGQLQDLPGAESQDLAEVALVIAGKNALQNIQTGKFDPDFAFTFVGRMTELIDTEVFIQQILDALETEKPGSRVQLESSRARVGTAELFDLPSELLGPASVPFPVGAAVGQGEAGTMFSFGKTDNIRAFLTGQTDGTLPSGLASTLARRGQIWIYLPLHPSMMQQFSDRGGMTNPMMDGFAEGFHKVKEFGMGFSFASSKLDVELVLGCADNAAARELTQNMQQFIGLMQMVSAQNPGKTAPFLGKLKTASDGTTFRVTTELTARDLDLALEGVAPGSSTTRRSSTSTAALPRVEPREPPSVPVALEVLELLPGDIQSLRHTRLRIDNRSDLAVRDVRLTFHYFNHANQRVGQWTRRHMDPVLDTLAAAKTSREFRCPIFHVPTATHRVTATLNEVTFADGSKWVPNR